MKVMRMRRWFLFFINICIVGMVSFTPPRAYGAILNPSELKNQGSIIDVQNGQQPNTPSEIDKRLQNIN